MSHPSWVRGLKQNQLSEDCPADQSHPSWVRGLKHYGYYDQLHPYSVAPLVGAWIETHERAGESVTL